MSDFKVLILNNNSIVQYGIKQLLVSVDQNVKMYSAQNSVEFMELVNEHIYDLMIIDYDPTNMDEWNTIKHQIRINKSNILIFSEHVNLQQIRILYRLGVKGYLNVASDTAEITKAITTIINGKRYIPPFISELLEEEFLSPERPKSSLTQREIEILKFLIKGERSKDIANSLGIHSSTLGTHKFRILNKFRVTNVIKLKEYIEKFQPELL